MEGECSVVVTCTGCAMFVFLPQDRSDFVCTKCKLVSILEEKVRGLEKQVSTLRCIQKNEDFLDRRQDMLLQAQRSEESEQVAQRGLRDGEENWQYVSPRRRKRSVHLPAMEIQVSNRFHVLSTGTNAESGIDITSEGREQKGTPPIGRHEMHCPRDGGSTTTAPKRRRRVVVVRDSLLRGTESSICRPNRENREVCCLPGARIHDVTERLPRLIKPSDRYAFLLLHVGTNDAAKNDLEWITADYVALGRRIKEVEAQLVFSSILPVQGKGLGRDRRIVEVNKWLRRWCWREGFGFFDHGMVFQEGGVLGRDGLHLMKRGKNIFTSRLANLVRRALN
uniref:SGNH hydrolase-type esterase domain-containing protein n=1 Tax=Chrysemys picta bellii TaxID=8478 RepID=A0A8C3FMA3_CHRPI